MVRDLEILSDANPYLRHIEYVIDNKVIGYLEYSYIIDRIEVDNFFVEEIYRNRGIGTKLLSALVASSISKHVVNITLEVRVSNDVARGLYKKFGFREVALRRFYYGDEDGILMEKQVM